MGDKQDEIGLGIAVLNNTSYHVVGWTGSVNFPTTPGSAQPHFGGGSTDAFVTKLA